MIPAYEYGVEAVFAEYEQDWATAERYYRLAARNAPHAFRREYLKQAARCARHERPENVGRHVTLAEVERLYRGISGQRLGG